MHVSVSGRAKAPGGVHVRLNVRMYPVTSPDTFCRCRPASSHAVVPCASAYHHVELVYHVELVGVRRNVCEKNTVAIAAFAVHEARALFFWKVPNDTASRGSISELAICESTLACDGTPSTPTSFGAFREGHRLPLLILVTELLPLRQHPAVARGAGKLALWKLHRFCPPLLLLHPLKLELYLLELGRLLEVPLKD